MIIPPSKLWGISARVFSGEVKAPFFFSRMGHHGPKRGVIWAQRHSPPPFSPLEDVTRLQHSSQLDLVPFGIWGEFTGEVYWTAKNEVKRRRHRGGDKNYALANSEMQRKISHFNLVRGWSTLWFARHKRQLFPEHPKRPLLAHPRYSLFPYTHIQAWEKQTRRCPPLLPASPFPL